MLSVWHRDMLSVWHRDKLSVWHRDSLSVWHRERLSVWHRVMFSVWHRDRLSVWHRDRFPLEYFSMTSSGTIPQIQAVFIYLIVKTTSTLANASVFKQNTRKEYEKDRTVPRPSEYSLNIFRMKLLHLLDLSRNKNNKVRLCQYKHEELKKCNLAMWSCSDGACSHVLQNSEKMTRQCLRPNGWSVNSRKVRS